MKVSVIESFFDKSTGEPYNRGDIYEGDKDRVAELRDGGFLAPVPAKKATATNEADTETGSTDNIGAADGATVDTDSGKTGK